MSDNVLLRALDPLRSGRVRPDGYELLAIRLRKKVPELLAEALDLLEERYGRVG